MFTSAVEAVLQTGALETRYFRAGTGASVLLLFPDAMTDPLAAQLFERLALHVRVIAPLLPAGIGPGARGSVSKWLREVIDGLGVTRPSVIAEESLVGALLGFSLIDPGRVGGVVAVCRDDADPATSIGMLHAVRGFLVVTIDTARDVATGAEAAVAEMIPFLDREACRA